MSQSESERPGRVRVNALAVVALLIRGGRETAVRVHARDSDLVDDFVGEPVFDRFLRVQIEVAVGVAIDPFDRLA